MKKGCYSLRQIIEDVTGNNIELYMDSDRDRSNTKLIVTSDGPMSTSETVMDDGNDTELLEHLDYVLKHIDEFKVETLMCMETIIKKELKTKAVS